jgi:hypothetical protein
MHVRLTDRFVKSAVPKGRKSPIFMDDEVIGFACSSFAALMSPEVADFVAKVVGGFLER